MMLLKMPQSILKNIMGKDKLKRFAEMETFDNVFQPQLKDITIDSHLKGTWSDFFKNSNPIVLELGCGKGEYTVGMARKYPNKNFIGIDIKGARIWRGAKTAVEEGLNNVAFLRTKVDFVERFFAKNEVSEIWLTFSDPQPKRPRKRLTSPLFINRYKNILNDSATINLKCDSDLLYEYTLEQIEENKYETIENSNDVYGELMSRANQELQDLMNIRTFYEQRWINEGKTIKYLKFEIN